MANDISALQPVLYSTAALVAKEPAVLINSINMDFDNKGVALGDSVKVMVSPPATQGAFTPAMALPTGTDKVAESLSVAITAQPETSWNLTGEQMKSLENGENLDRWVPDMIAQGMRTIRNGAEAALAGVIYKGASRAFGTAGTTPFASDLTDITALKKAMLDNGAPMSDWNLVVDSSAGENLGNLAVIQQSDKAGGSEERARGIFLQKYGFMIKESAGIQTHTKGSGLNYDITAAGGVVGDTTLNLEGGDSGTILPGDVATFAGGATDLNKYVVNSGGTASGAAAGTIEIGKPGLKVVKATADEMTIGDSYVANIAFVKGAIVGIVRPPIIPVNPTITVTQISDETGMTYFLLDMAGYGMRTWQLVSGYGFKVLNSQFVFNLMG